MVVDRNKFLKLSKLSKRQHTFFYFI